MGKLKICDGCNKERPIWKRHLRKGYCQSCWNRLKPELLSVEPKPIAVRQPLARVSPKRAKEERIYAGRRVIFLTKNPVCKAALPGICTKRSCEVHHKRGRVGELYLDERYWLPVCHECHCWIEVHPEEAKALGLSLNRLQNDEQESTKEEV